MSYIQNFKKFVKDTEKKPGKETGANPQMIEEDDAILTDPKLTNIETQIRNSEKQLEVLKQQRETIMKELRDKAAVEKEKQTAQANATPPAAPTA